MRLEMTLKMTSTERKLSSMLISLSTQNTTIETFILHADNLYIKTPGRHFLKLLNNVPLSVVEKIMDTKTYHWMRWCEWFCYLYRSDVEHFPVAYDTLFGAPATFRGFTDITIVVSGGEFAGEVGAMISPRERNSDKFIIHLINTYYRE